MRWILSAFSLTLLAPLLPHQIRKSHHLFIAIITWLHGLHVVLPVFLVVSKTEIFVKNEKE